MLENKNSAQNLPPMLLSYLEYKEEYPDCIIFLQVGDFYEVFFDDAVTVARAINLTLTSRDRNSPDPIPMCGVPIASVDSYLSRLVQQKFSVAVVSQVATDEVFGEKKSGPIERRLTRIVTPGMHLLGENPNSGETLLLAAIAFDGENTASLAWSEVQSGVTNVRELLGREELFQILKNLDPIEILIAYSQLDLQDGQHRLSREIQQRLPRAAIKKLKSFEVPERLLKVECFRALAPLSKKAVAGLVATIDQATPKSKLSIVIANPQKFESQKMVIDATTRSNLELVANLRDRSTRGSLLGILDSTRTAHGGRFLRASILEPLIDKQQIEKRHEAVEALFVNDIARERLHRNLHGIADLERIASRIELLAVTPRELAEVRKALNRIFEFDFISNLKCDPLLSLLQEVPDLSQLHLILKNQLSEDPALAVGQGAVIRSGFSAELDGFRLLSNAGDGWIKQFEADEKIRTDIPSLKVKFNHVLGFHIEVTRSNLGKVPAHYIRRQVTVNGERYTTEELRQKESEVLGASQRELLLERKLFEELKFSVKPFVAKLRSLSEILAQFDFFLALAEVARKNRWNRPRISEKSVLNITKGRHPVLEVILQDRFVPNGVELDPERINYYIITGPNMGGKSTFLRQTALIVILAQLGSFVPAEAATIGIVDQVFARVGASDNLAEGESTFMVEMREAALILQRATSKSLLIVDELGRGTATADGVALAQAILEWVATKVQARMLFATHFHELSDLEGQIMGLSNLSVASIEQEGQVIFTHAIMKGPAPKSYGLEVALLAGVPKLLVSRAREIFNSNSLLEKSSDHPKKQLPLFQNQYQERPLELLDDNLRRRLREVDPNELSPREALLELYELKTLL